MTIRPLARFIRTSPRQRGGRARAGLHALLLALASSAAAPAVGTALKLHVPSPDWRDQIIYFAVTDRFADGDPANNDLGAGEFEAGSPKHYNGGDLKGLAQRLDYVRGLGATALWITPPVLNLWRDGAVDYTGYHGYWAADFSRVDPHAGTLADYRRLSHGLHSRGMYLVQDIVVNHTGNFFSYAGGWDAGDPTRDYRPNAAARPQARPVQPPFDRNDPRDPAQRRDAIYHWTPDVADYADPAQEANWQMAGLDDLNTENPRVRRALRASHGGWIGRVGVDAFRVDTAFYVPPDFFADFLHSRDRHAPGIDAQARRSGRRDFFVFGEGFAIDRPFDDTQARKIERYRSGPGGAPLLPGMLNFPLYGTLGDVFARGRPTAELGWRIAATLKRHARPHWMVNFVDNHDVDRFLAGGSEAALKQALLAMMTLPGIPVIYYGTEQAFREPRASMFAAGWGSGGRDHYDTAAPLYRYIAGLSALRRASHLFSRGVPTVLAESSAGPGVIAWRTDHDGEAALVVLNTSDRPALADNLDVGVGAGRRLAGRFGIDGRPADLATGADGRVHLPLPPRSGYVWTVGPAVASASASASSAALAIEAPPATVDGDFVLSGQAPGVERVQIVVDGDLDAAVAVTPGAAGHWQAPVDTSRMADAAQRHRIVAWDGAAGTASAAGVFRVARPWRLLAEAEDPAGDDAGPLGRYQYPPGPGYAGERPADLRRVRISGAGGALRIELEMNRVLTLWNPPNGFDHVVFTIYIEVPGRPGGARVMPLQNAELPPGMRWHYRLRAHGWSNALFGADGAAADREGTAVVPAAAIEVDRERRTVAFVLPAAALGNPASTAGTKVYVTTWDYDGGYRALAPQAADSSFGGGAAGGAKVMDDTPVIVLP